MANLLALAARVRRYATDWKILYGLIKEAESDPRFLQEYRASAPIPWMDGEVYDADEAARRVALLFFELSSSLADFPTWPDFDWRPDDVSPQHFYPLVINPNGDASQWDLSNEELCHARDTFRAKKVELTEGLARLMEACADEFDKSELAATISHSNNRISQSELEEQKQLDRNDNEKWQSNYFRYGFYLCELSQEQLKNSPKTLHNMVSLVRHEMLARRNYPEGSQLSNSELRHVGGMLAKFADDHGISGQRIWSAVVGVAESRPDARQGWDEALLDYHSLSELATQRIKCDPIVNQGLARGGASAAATDVANSPSTASGRRSTSKGEAREKIIAGISAHHRVDGNSCLNCEPIQVNKFADQIGVASSSVSDFLKERFSPEDGSRAYRRYTAACRDGRRLALDIKAMTGDLTPSVLFNQLRDPSNLPDE